MSEPRRLQMNVRLSEEEHARLRRVAEHYGLGYGNVLRMLLKHAEDEIDRDVEVYRSRQIDLTRRKSG